MSYLHMFINEHYMMLIIFSILSLLIGFYNNQSTQKYKYNLLTGGFMSVAITSVSVLNMNQPSLLRAGATSLLIIISFLFGYLRSPFIRTLSTATILGFTSTFIITAGAVGTPEAAIPTALIGGLICGVINVFLEERYPDLSFQIQNDIMISYLPFVLLSNLNVYFLTLIIIAIRISHTFITSK